VDAISPARQLPGLVLWAHGGVGRSGVPEGLAARLRSMGHFSEVAPCSLTGNPGLAETLRGMTAEPVYLVPLLMAEGYTYCTVLPQLLADAPERRVVQCRPVGVGPGLDAVIIAQALEACAARKFKPGETTLMLAAHGTQRHAGSGDAADKMASRIATTKQFHHVCASFLEQPPLVDVVLQSIAPRPCVVVGFFMDYGVHSAEDIPRIIAAVHPDAADAGPIGARPEIAEIILDLVQAEASPGG